MSEERTPNLEQKLLKEIAEIKRRMVDLQAEQRSLERILVRIRGESLEAADVTRKNSINRLIVENAVVELMRERGNRTTSMNTLWNAARSALPGLKQSTFRSYLSRLKAKGAINSPKYGVWVLADHAELPISSTITDT